MNEHHPTSLLRVVDDRLLQPANLFSQSGCRLHKTEILFLQLLDAFFEPGNSFQFSVAASSCGDSIASALPFEFRRLLVVHVDRSDGWKVDRGQSRHRICGWNGLCSFRLGWKWSRPRLLVDSDGGRCCRWQHGLHRLTCENDRIRKRGRRLETVRGRLESGTDVRNERRSRSLWLLTGARYRGQPGVVLVQLAEGIDETPGVRFLLLRHGSREEYLGSWRRSREHHTAVLLYESFEIWRGEHEQPEIGCAQQVHLLLLRLLTVEVQRHLGLQLLDAPHAVVIVKRCLHFVFYTSKSRNTI
jgi:hypothetical protein